MNSIKNWERLRELRKIFLGEKEPKKDYWEDAELLELYDQTFGARIGWKWEAVLKELPTISPPISLVDYGCGTGIASRAWLAHPNHQNVSSLHLIDRSSLAEKFAQQKIGEIFPKLAIDTTLPSQGAWFLLSHLLNELPDTQNILSTLSPQEGFIWVEPGTPVLSKQLGKIREHFLVQGWSIVAPCPHAKACPALASDDWCHFFAEVPNFVFQNRFWSEFSHHLEIDLRSLPVSFLIMQRSPTLPLDNSPRLIGRPHFEKPGAKCQVCSNKGLEWITVHQKKDKEQFKELRRHQKLRTVFPGNHGHSDE